MRSYLVKKKNNKQTALMTIECLIIRYCSTQGIDYVHVSMFFPLKYENEHITSD